MTLEIGGVTFELLHTPGETPDHLTVWIPQYKAAFVGDNYYDSFPNIYTLRGTQPRWALDYVQSLNKVLALEPELVLPSHGQPIRGRDEIRRRLTRYRDAIHYVHDETVAGMNAGKDVFTLMGEIKLPPDLDIGETYGKISWSVRGIYEGYVGWFDGNPASMFGTPAAAYDEIVRLAGGPAKVAARARELARTDPVRALYLADMALAADPRDVAGLETRLEILKILDRQSANSNERGWIAGGHSRRRGEAETVIDYRNAGVDIDAGNETVRRIRSIGVLKQISDELGVHMNWFFHTGQDGPEEERGHRRSRP